MGPLGRRMVVAAIGIPITVAAVYAGGLTLALLLAVLAGAGTWELFRLARGRGVEPLDGIGIPLAVLVPLGAHAWRFGWIDAPIAASGTVFVALAGAVLFSRGPQERPLETAAVTTFGVLYCGATLAFAYALRHHRFIVTAEGGAALVLFPVVLTWISDTAAYAFGRWLGRRRLMERVSPGKTVAGAVGGLATAVAGAWLYNAFILKPIAELALAPWTALAFGVVISAAGQVGDLVESLFKREAGVKDSSSLLSAHGGVLDRLDSLYFVFPAAYLVLGRLLLAAPR